ncbi:hypothetical protein [Myxosarcina sp. GI1(2024)]
MTAKISIFQIYVICLSIFVGLIVFAIHIGANVGLAIALVVPQVHSTVTSVRVKQIEVKASLGED